MTRDELIAKLQEMPENVEVKTVQRAECCCGECFCPMDGENTTDEVAFYPYTRYKNRRYKAYILIS